MPADPATRKKRDDDIKALTTAISKLDAELRPLLPAVERADKLAKTTPADLQKALPADAVLVDFLAFTRFEQDPKFLDRKGRTITGGFLAFVVTRDAVKWVDLGPAEPIAKAVYQWREAITSGKNIPAAIPAKVRELVWAKVRKEIPAGTRVVYIAPDLALCRVPWAAIPGDKGGTILLEDFAVAVVPHAGFLLDKLWPREPNTERPTTLVVGGVEFGESPLPALRAAVGVAGVGRGAEWAALPGAASEARGVVAAVGRKKLEPLAGLLGAPVAVAAGGKKLEPRQLGGDKATASVLLAALPTARHAHFATHGFFADLSFQSAFRLDPRHFELGHRGERVGHGALSPLVMTGLVLAGANDPKTPGRGILTGEALIDLDLSGLELAVLSSCESGLGDVVVAEGSFGLQRAFHLAGTRDVVASLWKVPDRATAALMAEFYRNLWEKKLEPVFALQEAQLEIYRNPGKIPELAAAFRGTFDEVPGGAEEDVKPGPDGKANPRLWAAFTLSGPGR
jgi:CHAT domain-containing protein